MTPLKDAAIYALGGLALAAVTNQGWLIPLGIILAASALARAAWKNYA